MAARGKTNPGVASNGLIRYISRGIMKNSCHCRRAVACLWLASFALIHAADQSMVESDPFGDGHQSEAVGIGDHSRQIRVLVEYIEVSHEQFTELMFGAEPAANDSALRKRLAQLIKDGKASVMETMLCTVQDGRKATAFSAEEFIYPTEYEPAEIPTETPFKEGDPPKVSSERILDAVGPTPTAFETRNLGPSLEMQPTASADGRYIDLRIVPEIVYHAGNTVWAEWKGKHGNSPIQMPQFYTLSVNTGVTVVNGRHALLAALSPKDDKGFTDSSRKIMIFARVDVIAPGN